MRPVKEAKKYAKTFINTVGMDEAPRALDELATIDSLMSKSKEFRVLLSSPVFTQPERDKAFTDVAGKMKLSEKTIKFTRHLTQLRMIGALPEIIKNATAIYLERKKRAKATVLTPVEISKTHEDRLRDALKKILEKEVDIEYVLDPSLLGGVLVKVGSTMYDSSIKGQLRLLKDELIKG